MRDAQRFFFSETYSSSGLPNSLPYLQLTLNYANHSINVSGLLDTGATINVLPYQIGLDLGAVWEEQTISLPLAGNLAASEAKLLILSATVSAFAPVRLAFAWTNNRNAPVILGQVNFFLEFDVCFYRSQGAFDIRPKPI
ncbi:hypothetical protein [Kamptonema sp. UHCC 0994]|uniref:hypothetical protein n=1 Tax=Kamptonema sp. UHCC 0994 TaxID=3031329 RepID=UPI0023B907A7|nr:hypothetical protein [Kamptonema sp. UHCC 0994]MDF0554953.1 hypothetical protein [Kamptonema sp. UHCC 0994]